MTAPFQARPGIPENACRKLFAELLGARPGIPENACRKLLASVLGARPGIPENACRTIVDCLFWRTRRGLRAAHKWYRGVGVAAPAERRTEHVEVTP